LGKLFPESVREKKEEKGEAETQKEVHWGGRKQRSIKFGSGSKRATAGGKKEERMSLFLWMGKGDEVLLIGGGWEVWLASRKGGGTNKRVLATKITKTRKESMDMEGDVNRSKDY